MLHWLGLTLILVALMFLDQGFDQTTHASWLFFIGATFCFLFGVIDVVADNFLPKSRLQQSPGHQTAAPKTNEQA